jgi:hypothetical protein
MDLNFDPLNPPHRSKLVSYTLLAALLVLVVFSLVAIFHQSTAITAPKPPAIHQPQQLPSNATTQSH